MDIITYGGSSHYLHTERRIKALDAHGILNVGIGLSGGEEGARRAPSIIPEGSPEAWPHIQPIFQSIAARVGPALDIPCCEWIGPGGSGALRQDGA